MEEQILKILNKNLNATPIGKGHSITGIVASTKEITSHMMEFIQWFGMNCEGSTLNTWVLFTESLQIIAEFHSSEEMYKYWITNIHKS